MVKNLINQEHEYKYIYTQMTQEKNWELLI